MKYIKYIFIPIVIILIGTNLSCERDDICPASTPTTPRVKIVAYDDIIRENRKNVFGLRIEGVGMDTALEGYDIVSEDDLILPLRTDTTVTQYSLRKDTKINTDGTFDGNQDIITIKYTTEEVYVSRACGYKTIFKNVSLTIEKDDDNWIQSRQATNENQSVEDEKEAHFSIFH